MDPKTGNITTTSYDALAKRNGTATAIEGSVIWKEGDYYYLFTSWDACCEDLKSTYNIRVGRSKTYVVLFICLFSPFSHFLDSPFDYITFCPLCIRDSLS